MEIYIIVYDNWYVIISILNVSYLPWIKYIQINQYHIVDIRHDYGPKYYILLNDYKT